MFERLQRSWELVKESWHVLRQDRELVLFPVLSGIASLLVLATFAIPVLLMIPWGELAHSSAASGERTEFHVSGGPLHYVGVFLYYLVSYFVIVFFNTGLVACVRKRFAGGDPTLADGLRFASSNVGRIFQWALLAATVGMILRAIEERAAWLGRIVAGLLGLVWTLATTFVVPVLVYEQVGPIDAVKRSAEAFRRTWGETVVANWGLNTAFGLLFFAGMLVLACGIGGGIALMGSAASVGLGVMITTIFLVIGYWVALAIIQSALQGIFLTACYEYAATGRVPSAFTPDYVIGAWVPK